MTASASHVQQQKQCVVNPRVWIILAAQMGDWSSLPRAERIPCFHSIRVWHRQSSKFGLHNDTASSNGYLLLAVDCSEWFDLWSWEAWMEIFFHWCNCASFRVTSAILLVAQEFSYPIILWELCNYWKVLHFSCNIEESRAEWMMIYKWDTSVQRTCNKIWVFMHNKSALQVAMLKPRP